MKVVKYIQLKYSGFELKKENMLYIAKDLYEIIINDHVSDMFETGGFIGIQNNEICRYRFDSGIKQKYAGMYRPNSIELDMTLTSWMDEGISIFGIVHRHLNNLDQLSLEDICFIKELLKVNEWIKVMYFPIVIPKDKMTVFGVERISGNIKFNNVNLKII